VVIHPGTSEFGRIKRWPLDRFAALADRIQHHLDRRVIISWGPGERAMAEEISRSARCRPAIAPETRSLLDLAELIRCAAVFIGSDSGPMHLANAVGIPCVALFGPKDPVVYGPYGSGHRIVFKPNGEGLGAMNAITVEDAFSAVQSLLSGQPRE
jgi:ADP-heptose:LPS heptosyltransferase